MVIVALSSHARCDKSLPACAFFFFQSRSARIHKFHSLGLDQTTVAQQAEMIVTKCP